MQIEARPYFIFLCCCSILYVVIFSLMKDLSVLSHHSYFDYAIYLVYFNSFVQGKGLITYFHETVVPGSSGHWLANHFTPLIYIFAFAFKVFPSFRMVNWLHTVFLGSSPIILYVFSHRFIGKFGAFCISLALLFNPTFQYTTLYEFDFLRFIIPSGILMLGFCLRDYPAIYIILSLFIVLLMREDAAFFAFGIGVFMFFFQKKRRILGFAVIVVSILYLLIVLHIIMPYFRGEKIGNDAHVAAYMFYEFGRTPGEIIKNIFLSPIAFFKHIFHPLKLINWYMYFLPYAFVPYVLVISLPTLIFLSYSGSIKYISYMLYYVSPILVVVTWATVTGLHKVSNICQSKGWFKKWLKNTPSIERLSFAVLAASMISSIYFGPSPISLQFWFRNFKVAPLHSLTFYKDRYKPSLHDEIIHKAAKMIPEDASVMAEFFLLTEVYKNKEIRCFPLYYIFEDLESIFNVDYIFIDKKHPMKAKSSGGPFKAENELYYIWIENRPNVFEQIFYEDGVFLFKRRH